MNIFNREVVGRSSPYLDSDEIILFIGPRQSGKTTVLKMIQNSLEDKGHQTFFFNLEDPSLQKLLNGSPKNLFQILPLDLKEKVFVFVDEIQYLENPTNFLKYLYDEYAGKIKLIVSGSSAFYIDRKFKDSLAGRKRIFPVLTLSFREFLRFKSEDSLADLLPKDFRAENPEIERKISFSERDKIRVYFNEFAVFGGYPRVVLAPLSEKPALLQEMAYSFIKKDIFEANIKQDKVFYQLLKILAAQVGSLVNVNELSLTLEVSRHAIDNYLYVMEKSFHVFLLRPFSRNVRKELTKMSKVFFYDLGLRNFFANNFQGIGMRADRGQVLENIIFRQLLERADVATEKINFWRTQSGSEVDFIFDETMAFESKSSARAFNYRKYEPFFKAYPQIKFNIVSLDGGSLPFPHWFPWTL